MLVTEGLNELKLLDSRIRSGINGAHFVASAKTVEKKVTPNVTKEEFIANAEASYQSITDLINRRAAIKAAIVSSNAETMVEVNGENMTVATAIEMKNSIEYEKGLLNAMKNNLSDATARMNSSNARLEMDLDEKTNALLGKDGKTKREDFAPLIASLRADGEYSLVDPLNAQEKIDALSERIEGFLSQVDSVLQISNCITQIELGKSRSE